MVDTNALKTPGERACFIIELYAALYYLETNPCSTGTENIDAKYSIERSLGNQVTHEYQHWKWGHVCQCTNGVSAV